MRLLTVLGILIAILGILYAVKFTFVVNMAQDFGALDLIAGVFPQEAEIDDIDDDAPPLESLQGFQLARRLYELEKYTECHEVLSGCADDSECINFKSELVVTGMGVPRNRTLALELAQQAAEMGNADAQYHLGMSHFSIRMDQGEFEHEEAKGILYSYAASTQGHIGALMGMGYRHMEGYGVPQSCTTAALNYVEVAKRITAIYSAGMPQAVELIRLNLDKKERKAMSSSEISLFMLIASSGDTGAAAAIGRRYLLGIDGFRQNYKKALQFLKIAADANH